jgi:hypothetical protein
MCNNNNVQDNIAIENCKGDLSLLCCGILQIQHIINVEHWNLDLPLDAKVHHEESGFQIKARFNR